MDLFSQSQGSTNAPLADRMRPRSLDEFIGQEHIVGKGKLLRRAIEADRLTSCIFYGPPGCGKTSLASVIALSCNAYFEKLNAVTAGVAEVREVIKAAENRLKLYNRPTYLLLDECHRWSKSQSDSILPSLENGIIRLVGSTAENPYVSMTPAILSRCRIFEFYRLNKAEIKKAMTNALLDKERGYGNMDIDLEEDALVHLVTVAGGDVRSALNALELAVLTTTPNENGKIIIDINTAEQSIQQKVIQCDESTYYDMLSAFCKSLRGGDANAGLYWAGRMLTAGVDARIIARRMTAHASEDVGLADPMALLQAMAAFDAVERLGMPECLLALSQAIIYICAAPKSNSVLAIHSAMADAKEQVEVPNHLKDTSYSGSEKLGRGEGYLYPHDFEGHLTEQQYLPDALKDKIYYIPSEQGFEKTIKEQMSKPRSKK